MASDRKPRADGEVGERVAKKPMSFADYAGAWREGRGMSMEEINAYMRWLRGYEDDAEDDRETR